MGAASIRRYAGQLAATTAIAGILATSAQAQQNIPLPGIDVTSSRLGQGIVGASTSIITAEEIARSPSSTSQDILSREPGIQVTNLFGGVNGVGSTVDMRGFGAAAASNSLILINGRRINDLDLVGIDLAAIPRDSIERIEITRGNSGAVLYGDGAVGGVINIVTKSGVGLPPKARFEGAFGSFRQREANGSFSGSSGPWSASVYGLGHEFRRLPGEQRIQAAQRRGRFPLHRSGGQRLSQPFRRRSGHRTARRPARRSQGRDEPARHQPARRDHALRLRGQAGRKHNGRHHPHAGAGRRADRRWRHAREKAAGAVLFCNADRRDTSTRSARSIRFCKRRR